MYETEEDESKKLPVIKVMPLFELDPISDENSSSTENLETKLTSNINTF